MSSFSAKQKRQSTMKHKKEAKGHIKRMYKILHKLDVVAKEMIKSGVAITEDNVVEEAAKYIDIEIGTFEKNILLTKVGQVYDKLGITPNE